MNDNKKSDNNYKLLLYNFNGNFEIVNEKEEEKLLG